MLSGIFACLVLTGTIFICFPWKFIDWIVLYSIINFAVIETVAFIYASQV